MALGVLRVGAGTLLSASGALMVVASSQRWAAACPWGDVDSGPCLDRQDHRYDFLAPNAPWEPVGNAAQLAGASLLVLGLAFLLLPWALTGRRPGVVSAAAAVGVALTLGAVGTATLRSGLAGSPVPPVAEDVVVYGWFVLPPLLLVRLAVAARGWLLAAAISLVLASPVVAAFSYAIGPYDAEPWWEAYSGVLTGAAGVCLLIAAAVHKRLSTHETAVKRPIDSPAGARPRRMSTLRESPTPLDHQDRWRPAPRGASTGPDRLTRLPDRPVVVGRTTASGWRGD